MGRDRCAIEEHEEQGALAKRLRTRVSLRPGRPGTKELLARYGDRLVRVRHRYDQQSGRSFKTVELTVEETSWRPRQVVPSDRIVEVRVEWQEAQVRRTVKGAGGIWNPRRRVWELRYDRVVGLGLEDRIVEDARG